MTSNVVFVYYSILVFQRVDIINLKPLRVVTMMSKQSIKSVEKAGVPAAPQLRQAQLQC